MSWNTNWQQDLSPVHHDSTGNTLYVPRRSDNMNDSFNADYTLAMLENCRKQYANKTEEMLKTHPGRFCKVSFDSIMCWPPIPFNSTATLKCFSEFNNMKYDDTKNITRYCSMNGTWMKANYLNCEYFELDNEITSNNNQVYYFVGYTISLIALTVAIFVFTYFKELRCLRNTIHLNLMWSHLLTHSMWILTLILLKLGVNTSLLCLFDVTFLHYFYVTTFFWMFVEGLYLYILVVKTLSRDTFKLRVYVCIGWGIPFLIILIWTITKSFVPIRSDPYYLSPTIFQCQWFEYQKIDWIYLTPTLAVLLLNLMFLFSIMCVLIMKLRSAPTLETKQYHKATRALLVLIPLLGITYVITIYAPAPDTPTAFIYECARAVMLSTQGFVVALFYCFLNSEVQNTLRHHYDNWKANRIIGRGRFRSPSKNSTLSHNSSRRYTDWTLVHGEDLENQNRPSVPCNNKHSRTSVSSHNGQTLLLID